MALSFRIFLKLLNPLNLALFFCSLLKISLRNPYLKILDLAKLFVADAPMKKKIIFYFTQSNLEYGSENRPWVRGLNNILSSAAVPFSSFVRRPTNSFLCFPSAIGSQNK